MLLVCCIVFVTVVTREPLLDQSTEHRHTLQMFQVQHRILTPKPFLQLIDAVFFKSILSLRLSRRSRSHLYTFSRFDRKNTAPSSPPERFAADRHKPGGPFATLSSLPTERASRNATVAPHEMRPPQQQRRWRASR